MLLRSLFWSRRSRRGVLAPWLVMFRALIPCFTSRVSFSFNPGLVESLGQTC